MEDKIISRIQKLYNQSISSSKIGNLEEAETFMLGVQRLLSEYNLEMSVIGNGIQKSVITESKVDYKGLVSYGEWEVDLMINICKYNWCKAIFNSYEKTITVIGRGDNIGVCNYLYNFIRINLVTLSKISYYKEIETLRNKIGRNVSEEFLHKNKLLPYRRYYIRDYLAGAVIGIGVKLKLQQEANSNKGLMGLMLCNKEEIVDYMNINYSNLETVDFKKIKRGKGYKEGYDGGLNLKIGEAIEADKVIGYL